MHIPLRLAAAHAESTLIAISSPNGLAIDANHLSSCHSFPDGRYHISRAERHHVYDGVVLTRKEAAGRLGVTEVTMDKLEACGLLSAERIARLVLFDEGQIEDLENRDDADLHLPAIVVRQGKPVVGDHRPRGWSEGWDEDTKIAAVSKWWPIRQLEHGGRGLPLVAIVSDWVVGYWRITRGLRQDGSSGDWEFEIAAAPDLEPTYFHRRVRLGPGPKVVKLPRA
jgi:hypothetical protein